ncbi:general amidase-B [Aspergillus arachidicola]|uniref:amidase n=2 Tax=Aspergillus arachidicola TaxID=656916 RepID=A0A2G7G967_9EURO|nr:general amidase-B [Aspergillus arachidicola]
MTLSKPADSPGNGFYPNSPPMRRPALSFIYRLECNIEPEEVNVGAPHGAGVIRSVANIAGGSFRGPSISGTVLPGGADWATVIEGTHVEKDPALRPPPTVTQDDVEFFSHLRIETGPGKYNWLNGLVCVGVMSCENDRILIDAYHLTNFEDSKPEDVMARRNAYKPVIDQPRYNYPNAEGRRASPGKGSLEVLLTRSNLALRPFGYIDCLRPGLVLSHHSHRPTEMAENAATKGNWETKVAEKRKQLELQIPQDWRLNATFLSTLPSNGHLIEADIPRHSGLLSEEELDLTEHYTAAQLLQKLAWGEVTSLAVTTAFCKRAAIAQQLTSCLTEHFFDRALERAQYLDDYLKREKRVMGPLHGLPISLKDSFYIKGIQSTVGYVSFLENPPAETNSALVDLLLDLGAVLYVKTNIPQTMMTGDSENNIYGRTLNPHNTNLTAGGSSGGEGALVAFRGSILGVGTDIAGSIRIPSLCCGVYGFKPTADRIPFGGQVSGAIEGVPGIKPAAGPLAQSLDDIELFMSTVLKAEPWRYDVTTIGSPWVTALRLPSLLTIGVLGEDPDFPVHPPVRRAMESAIAALAKKGHRIVRLEHEPSRGVAYASRLAFQYFTYGPHVDHIAASGEPLVASVAKLANPLFTGPFPVDQDLGIFEKIDGLYNARKAYAEEWRRTWVQHDIDVLLTPGAQSTATPHDTYGWPPYTVIWNLLDYPACILPYSKSSKALDPDPMPVHDGVQPSYEPDSVDGAPCALQIVTPRHQDEKCLLFARLIDKDIR